MRCKQVCVLVALQTAGSKASFSPGDREHPSCHISVMPLSRETALGVFADGQTASPLGLRAKLIFEL